MKIAVVGAAGTLGSCAAYTLVSKKLAEEILMIDPFEGALTTHWLDLDTVAANQGIKVVKGTYENLGGTDIVVMTAGAPSGAVKSRSEFLPASLPIVQAAAEQINKYCPKAIVIMETNPVDPMNYAMYLMSPDRDRRRYVGYSLNDSLRLRMWTARKLGVSADKVEGIVMGEHGGSQVMIFSSLRVNGQPVNFDEATKQEIREKPPILLNTFETLVPRRTAGWTSAYGTAIVVEAIRNNSRVMIPCNTVLQGEYGLKNISLTVPAILGKEGIEDVRIIPLAADEQAGMDNTVKILTPFMRFVEEKLGKN